MENNGILIARAVASHQANHGAHADLGYQIRRLNGVVIHVVEAGGSAANHLRTAHFHTLQMIDLNSTYIRDKWDRDELLLHGPDVVF